MTGGSVLRFSCTQCGMCCDRSPEVGLSETFALADVFIFRLMFRLHWLPQQIPSTQYFQQKRLLNTFAARKTLVKVWSDGKRLARTRYLLVSSLTLDTSIGACSALRNNRCGIYERRPSSCRSVPFHYSHTESAAESGLKAFVSTPGYRCDTSDAADIVLENGRIVAPAFIAARAEALRTAEEDRRWGEAIVRRLPAEPSPAASLPAMKDIETNALWGVSTTSMRIAWQIAAEIGVIGADRCRQLVESQLVLIEQALAQDNCSADSRQTLIEMRLEYGSALDGRGCITRL